MPIKSVTMKNFEKTKNVFFFLMSQGSLDLKIRFLGQKVCSVARVHMDRQTDTMNRTNSRIYLGQKVYSWSTFFLDWESLNCRSWSQAFHWDTHHTCLMASFGPGWNMTKPDFRNFDFYGFYGHFSCILGQNRLFFVHSNLCH